MTRNSLYALLAVLAVMTAVLGYMLYEERQKTAGIEIELGDSGLKVEAK